MPRQAELPATFAQYAKSVSYVQVVTPGQKWSSSCPSPSCGGSIHSEPGRKGEWPDRCVWFLDATPLGHCFRCGATFWPDAQVGWQPPSPAQLEEQRQRWEQIELENKRKAEMALAWLRDKAVWTAYHDQMGDLGRSYWRRAGIPDSWQDYLQLGWCDSKSFWRKGEEFTTPTATLPVFDIGWQPLNVMHRLINAQGSDKYRPEISGQGQQLYWTDPDLDLTDHTIVVEGQKKGIVTKITLDSASVCVVATPGTNLNADLVERLAGPSLLTLIFDPGSRQPAWELCKKLGISRCRVLIPSMKVDDGIVAAQFGKAELGRMIANAKPAGRAA